MTAYVSTPHAGRDLTSSFDKDLAGLLGLEVEGDIAYVMKRSDGLWAIKSTPHGGSHWYKLSGPNAGEKMASGKSKLSGNSGSDETGVIEEPVKYELGWYQTQKAELYKYDGEQWTDGKRTVLVSNSVFKTLEFLG